MDLIDLGEGHSRAVACRSHFTTLSLSFPFYKVGSVVNLFRRVAVKRRDRMTFVPCLAGGDTVIFSERSLLLLLLAQVGSCSLNNVRPFT